MRLTPTQAMTILEACGIPLFDDFHALRSTQVALLLTYAEEQGYRAPPRACGSRARYYHAYLQRTAQRYFKR